MAIAVLVASAYVLRRERLGCGEGARGAGRCAELAARGAAPMGRLGERRVLRDGGSVAEGAARADAKRAEWRGEKGQARVGVGGGVRVAGGRCGEGGATDGVGASLEQGLA